MLRLAGLVLIAALQTVAQRLPNVSFAPPFDKHDRSGARIIDKNWNSHGSSKIAKNFLRLTPDRQSKKGSAWTTGPIGVPALTVIVEFRISGKGRRFFGDGIGLWLAVPDHRTNNMWDDDFAYDDYDEEGYLGGNGAISKGQNRFAVWPMTDFHAFQPSFKGVGVLLDTYVNEGHLNHRDVTVIVNDKTRNSQDAISHDALGCMSSFRYHEERDDFHAGKVSSRLKLSLVGNSISVDIDPQNEGQWRECARVTVNGIVDGQDTVKAALEDGWLAKAHIGITASTGELSDNHDVIRVEVFKDDASAEEAEAARRSNVRIADGRELTIPGEDGKSPAEAPVVPTNDLSLEERIVRLETYLNVMLVKLDLVEHHLEHEMIDLAQTTGESANTLKIQEDKLEEQVKIVAKKLEATELRLADLVLHGIDNADKKASQWRLPMTLLVLILLVCATGVALYWRRLQKRHLL